MHGGMPYGLNQGQGQGHSREVDRQSPTGLIFISSFKYMQFLRSCYFLEISDGCIFCAVVSLSLRCAIFIYLTSKNVVIKKYASDVIQGP